MRDPSKFQLPLDFSQVTVVEGDLLRLDDYGDLLAQMDIVIHLAADWGNLDRCRAVNVTKTLELFNRLNPDRCRKILYFSTASLLDRHKQPLAVASRAGTDYIRTKYEMLMLRSEVELCDRLITLYPTLVFGGSPNHPYSHITAGLHDVLKWIGLIRFFKVDGSFHFIHAADIAQVVAHFIDSAVLCGDWVLGNPPLQVNDCVAQICAAYQQRIYFRIPVPVRVLRAIAVLLGAKLSEWDDYYIQHRHFVYDAVNAETYHHVSYFPTVASLLQKYG